MMPNWGTHWQSSECQHSIMPSFLSCVQSYKDTRACLWFCLILSFSLYLFLLLQRSRVPLLASRFFIQHGRSYAWKHHRCSLSGNSRISNVRHFFSYMFSEGAYSNLIFVVFSEPPRCKFSCIIRISRMIGKFRSSLCVSYSLCVTRNF